MKSNKYERRFYRNWIRAKDLYLTRISVKETDLQILTDKPIEKNFLKERVSAYRQDIEGYIAKDRRFFTSLKPIPVELHAPAIVRAMAKGAKKANVGPMAAVAGAIAQYIGKDLLRRGVGEVIIENGGDIFMKTKKIRYLGIYAGRSKLSGKFSLRIHPADTPLGVATSSGSVGHSLNFGNADAVVILGKDALLADSVATATANLVESANDFRKAIDFAKKIPQICGILIILKDNLAIWGKIELVGVAKTKNA